MALACVTVTDAPATEIVALRVPPGLAAATRLTEAEPVPEDDALETVIQAGRLEMVQTQPAPVVIVREKLPPEGGATGVLGDMAYAQTDVDGVSNRMALFPVSATYTFPLASTATPKGTLS